MFTYLLLPSYAISTSSPSSVDLSLSGIKYSMWYMESGLHKGILELVESQERVSKQN